MAHRGATGSALTSTAHTLSVRTRQSPACARPTARPPSTANDPRPDDQTLRHTIVGPRYAPASATRSGPCRTGSRRLRTGQVALKETWRLGEHEILWPPLYTVKWSRKHVPIAFFTERRHSELSAVGLTESYETPPIALAEVLFECPNSSLVRMQCIADIES